MGRKSATTDFIKSFDDFSKPITLRYNKGGAFASAPGGCLTILVNCVLLWWLANTLEENRSYELTENLTESMDWKLTDRYNETSVNLTPKEFDFMV